MSDVLTLEDLRITYHTAGGGIPAVRGVNLNVKKPRSGGVTRLSMFRGRSQSGGLLVLGKRNVNGQGGPPGRSTRDGQRAAQLLDTFPHTGETEMMRAWHRFRLKSTPIVFDD